jgi:damage-control phosphatase, subfamily I
VGIDKLAKIVDNGFDAPSTVLESSSKEFQQLFKDADLVIAKGMGNLEGLLNVKKENLYFLFMVKCDIIGNLVGAKTGDFLAMQNVIN